MTTWDYLIAKSALTAGTAYDHLLSIKQAMGNVFLAKSFITVEQQATTIVEPSAPATVEAMTRSSDSATYPFQTTAKQFCMRRASSVFVLMRSKTSP